VWTREDVKIVLCYGEEGKFAIITTHSLPVLVTFTSAVVGIELFQNKMGLTCALVRFFEIRS